ncbi:MAG: MraY family glycosyltransferase [bacterium]|nr:MraY family glycosyltransferase [bacterium]
MKGYLNLILVPVAVVPFVLLHIGGLKGIFFWQCFFIFCATFLLSVSFTPVSRNIALKLKILDYPSPRKIHISPMPLLGGAAIFAAFALVILVNFRFSLLLKGVCLGGTLLFVTGFIDDIKPIPASVRLLIQVIACLILARYGVMISFLPNVLWGKVGEFIITMFWIILIINAVNFFDGIDGLAAGMVAIVASFFLLVALQTHQSYFGYLGAALIGGCVGFLLYNFYPASIFLGNAGSSFLGFTLGALAVMGEWSTVGVKALSVPLLIFGIFIFDMMFIIVSRIINKETKTLREIIEYVGKDHLHHRLLKLGFTYRQVVIFIYLISVCFGLGAMVLRTSLSLSNVLFLLFQAIVIFGLLTFLMVIKKEQSS